MEFAYTALNKEGKPEKDVIEAVSFHEAVTLLHSKGLIPVDLREDKKTAASNIMAMFSTVGLQDKILFVQNLSVMTKAGIALTKALKILATQTHNPKFRQILSQVYLEVEAGKSLSEAFAKYPNTFPNIFISMFKIGEVSGTLDKSMEHLAVQLQREHQLISKTKGAMIYPAVVVFAIVVVGILMSIFVLPSLIGIFKESNMQLPLMTRIVIGFVDFMSSQTLLALGSLGTVVAVVVITLKTEKGKRGFDKLLVMSPVFGEISKKINIARFARTMSAMLKSGTPIIEGLEVTANSLGNSQYRDAVQQAAADVKIGKTLTSSLSQHPHLFSYLVTQMIGVGEESGTVDVILEEIAAHYEEEVDDTMRNLSAVIEPVMILFIGGVVGVLAIALIGPIYSLTQSAGG